MIIYRTTDMIPVEMGEIKFWISPLSFAKRAEIAQLSTRKAGVEAQDMSKIGYLTVKYGVKKVEGLKCVDGNEYRAEIGEDGFITDQAVEDIMNLDLLPKLLTVSMKLMESVKEHEIDGVKIDLKGVISSKK